MVESGVILPLSGNPIRSSARVLVPTAPGTRTCMRGAGQLLLFRRLPARHLLQTPEPAQRLTDERRRRRTTYPSPLGLLTKPPRRSSAAPLIAGVILRGTRFLEEHAAARVDNPDDRGTAPVLGDSPEVEQGIEITALSSRRYALPCGRRADVHHANARRFDAGEPIPAGRLPRT